MWKGMTSTWARDCVHLAKHNKCFEQQWLVTLAFNAFSNKLQLNNYMNKKWNIDICFQAFRFLPMTIQVFFMFVQLHLKPPSGLPYDVIEDLFIFYPWHPYASNYGCNVTWHLFKLEDCNCSWRLNKWFVVFCFCSSGHTRNGGWWVIWAFNCSDLKLLICYTDYKVLGYLLESKENCKRKLMCWLC
jgi:hypothetical protein